MRPNMSPEARRNSSVSKARSRSSSSRASNWSYSLGNWFSSGSNSASMACMAPTRAAPMLGLLATVIRCV